MLNTPIIDRPPVLPVKPFPTDIDELVSRREKYEHAIQVMEQRMNRGNAGHFQLSVQNAGELGIDPEIFGSLKASLDHTNAAIDRGELNAGQVCMGTTPTAPRAHASVSCAGQNLALHYWWGAKFLVNECVTQQVEADLGSASGITATLAAALSLTPAGVPLGIVSGILGLFAGAIQGIDVAGANHGVVFNLTWIGAFWIWHQ